METYRRQEKELINNKETLDKFNEVRTSVFKIRREITERESRGSASSWQGRETADAISDDPKKGNQIRQRNKWSK